MCNVGGTELDQLISRFSLPEMDQTWSRKGFRKRLPTLVDRQRPTFCWTISSNLGIPDPTNPPSAVGLELAAFFLFDWNPSVTDIREQYPLRLEDTSELAAQAHIRHPAVRGQIQIMSTDFLVDTNKPELPRMAIQVKTSSDLSNPRTIEKLELERRYWALKEVPWYLLTEKQIPKTVTKNITWLYPAQMVLDGIDNTLNMASLYLSFFIKHPTLQISQVAMMLDQAYSLSPGESLQTIRSLLALRVFLFDIRKPWSTLTVGDLQASSDINSLRNCYVANQ